MSTENKTVPQKPTSPDELNGLLKITRPYHWIAIIGIGALAFFAILWSIWGSIPQRITGIGEITTRKGLHGVTAKYAGEVRSVYFGLGDTVRAGEVMARLSQPELQQQLEELYTQRDVLQEQSNYLQTNNAANARIKDKSTQVERDRLTKARDEADKKISFLEIRLKEQDKLYKDGLITYTQYFQTKQDLSQAKLDRNQINENLLATTLGNDEWKLENTMKEKDLKGQLEALNKKIQDLDSEFLLETDVRATVTGIITSATAGSGDVITAGKNLFVIEELNTDNFKKLDLYIPFNANAQVLPGMEVQIEPFTVDENMYGWLVGEVVGVSHFVSSQQSIDDQINDPDLVSLITRNGPVYRVVVKLKQDTTTVSGYAFSNKKGPPFRIQTGTLCNAYVEVKKKAPIDYLIPIFKEYFD